MKILIVDDEPRHLRGMMNLIRRLRPDAEVTAAKDGVAALEQVRRDCPEAILTDIRMPHMDGLAFLGKLKEEGIFSKVIIVSAYNMFEYAQTAIRHGAYDYLLKPVEIENVERLLDRIELQLQFESNQRKETEALRQQLTLASSAYRSRLYLSWLNESLTPSEQGEMEKEEWLKGGGILIYSELRGIGATGGTLGTGAVGGIMGAGGAGGTVVIGAAGEAMETGAEEENISEPATAYLQMLEQAREQAQEQGPGQKLDQALDQALDQTRDQGTELSQEQTQEQGPEPRLAPGLEQSLEQVLEQGWSKLGKALTLTIPQNGLQKRGLHAVTLVCTSAPIFANSTSYTPAAEKLLRSIVDSISADLVMAGRLLTHSFAMNGRLTHGVSPYCESLLKGGPQAYRAAREANEHNFFPCWEGLFLYGQQRLESPRHPAVSSYDSASDHSASRYSVPLGRPTPPRRSTPPGHPTLPRYPASSSRQAPEDTGKLSIDLESLFEALLDNGGKLEGQAEVESTGPTEVKSKVPAESKDKGKIVGNARDQAEGKGRPMAAADAAADFAIIQCRAAFDRLSGAGYASPALLKEHASLLLMKLQSRIRELVDRKLDGRLAQTAAALVQDCGSYAELMALLERSLREIRQALRQIQQDQSEIVVANCLRWIEEHMKEDLTLERAADHFFFNASYFSTFMKNKTGRTFSEHVTAIRMKRAKELLAEDRLRIYEISAECGYQDTKYFCRVFKKYYGLSPQAYKHASLPERRSTE